MSFDSSIIKAALLSGDYVSDKDMAAAEDYAKKSHGSILEYLYSRKLLSKDLVGQALAESFKVPYADLNSNQPSADQVKKIPEEIAKKLRIILFTEDKKKTVVTTDNPLQKELATALKQLFPKGKVTIAFSLPEDIDQIFVHYQKSLDTRFSKIIEGQKRIAPELLEEIFDDALVFHASDIHFEPRRTEVVVRFRIDGVLQEAGRIAKEYYDNILNRIKVQSRLRIDEHFTAQDGSIHYDKNTHVMDMRTSIAPTVEGEKVVLRVLAAYVEGFSLADLGLSSAHQEILQASANKPFGMILVVGPTGSGKTTTLYALLKLLNSPDVNITTIEDPVEYKVEGVNQIQVNSQTSLTFAKGLRSIVRQDPDTILVGEIRDEETAEIAVNAALTGHLLLSTFHANDAATAIPRLLDMGIEPFLLASTMDIVVAQRLARKICDSCRYSVVKKSTDFNSVYLQPSKAYFHGKSFTFYEGKGCDACGHTGYKGRTAIFECIRITPAMQELITHKPSTQQIWQLARSEGSVSLFEDGVQKVKNGVTTLDELLRVAEPPKG